MMDDRKNGPTAKEIEILSWSWGAVLGEQGPPQFTGSVDFADGSTIEFDSLSSPGLAMALHAATAGGPFDDGGKDVFVHISAVERGSGPATYNAIALDEDSNLIGSVENGGYIDVIDMLSG